jgi:hypothetical protein
MLNVDVDHLNLLATQRDYPADVIGKKQRGTGVEFLLSDLSGSLFVEYP